MRLVPTTRVTVVGDCNKLVVGGLDVVIVGTTVLVVDVTGVVVVEVDVGTFVAAPAVLVGVVADVHCCF